MSVGGIDVFAVLVQTEVELCAVLDNGLVQRTEQHIVVLAQFRQREYQLPVILTGVAINERGGVVCSRAIGAYHLFGERPLQVDQQCLVKIKVTHIACMYVDRIISVEFAVVSVVGVVDELADLLFPGLMADEQHIALLGNNHIVQSLNDG